MLSFHHIPSRPLRSNSTSLFLDFSRHRITAPVRTATSHTTVLVPVLLFLAKCKAQIVVILFSSFQLCKAQIVIILLYSSAPMSLFHHIPSRCLHKTLLLILPFPGRRLASPVQLFCFVWVTGYVLQLLLTGASEAQK